MGNMSLLIAVGFQPLMPLVPLSNVIERIVFIPCSCLSRALASYLLISAPWFASDPLIVHDRGKNRARIGRFVDKSRVI